jgi:MerR family redox-sensitive transcriptional activator SoxR
MLIFMAPLMTISQVARQVGVRPSAIPYYEAIGVLSRPARSGGQRRYDDTALYHLALIQRARATGFTLGEIRQLFFGFRAGMPISERWRRLSAAKLVELAAQRAHIEAMEAALRRLRRNCHCKAVDQCGRAMFLGVRDGAGQR